MKITQTQETTEFGFRDITQRLLDGNTGIRKMKLRIHKINFQPMIKKI